jgi:hypothetical protein
VNSEIARGARQQSMAALGSAASCQWGNR